MIRPVTLHFAGHGPDYLTQLQLILLLIFIYKFQYYQQQKITVINFTLVVVYNRPKLRLINVCK